MGAFRWVTRRTLGRIRRSGSPSSCWATYSPKRSSRWDPTSPLAQDHSGEVGSHLEARLGLYVAQHDDGDPLLRIRPNVRRVTRRNAPILLEHVTPEADMLTPAVRIAQA